MDAKLVPEIPRGALKLFIAKALAAVALALACLLISAALVSESQNRDMLFQGGTLTEDTTLSANNSPYVIIQNIIVPAGITLTIEPSVTLQFYADRSIQVKGGRIIAEGTITQPITFTHHSDGYWGGILLEHTQQDNRIRYAVVEYTKEAITYPRTHGITAYSSRVTIADSVIRHTQVSGAVIAAWSSTLYLLRTEIYDIQGDAVHPTGGYAYIQGNHIHDIRNGIYPLEGIELSDINTPAVVIDNHIHDVSDDCLDMNYSSAIIKRNKFHHCGDKGISIGHYPSITTLVNNLIYECQGKDEDPYSGTGIAVKDGAVSHIMNNTVSGCRHGIYLYEGHQGQGGGNATIVNTIVWGNESGVDLDSLSTIAITYSNVEQAGSLPWPGEGNINSDPLFRAPQSGDLKLQPESPCVDTGTKADAPNEDLQGICRPRGLGYDMGAYELEDNRIGGTLIKDTTLAAGCHPTYIITESLVTPAGITLTIEPSVTLRFQTGQSLIVEGRLVAVGTPSKPIVFTRDDADSWDGIRFQDTTTGNHIAYATLEHAGFLPPSPPGIAAYSSTLRVEHSTVHHLGGTALFLENSDVELLENVIHDIQTNGVYVERGNAVVRGNHIYDVYGIDQAALPDISLGQGIEARNVTSTVQIQDNHVYSVSGTCTIVDQAATIVERNALHHCGNDGIAISHPSSTTLANNLIYACLGNEAIPYSGTGIALKDGATLHIANNTVTDNKYGINLYEEHGGEGGSVATVVNSIVWGNETDMIRDALSAITITYSNLYTYTITGTVILPGVGNINADPLFRAPQNGDYRLRQDSPCVDTGTSVDAPDEDIWGIYRPHGDGHDMGAHEFFEYFACYLPVVIR